MEPRDAPETVIACLTPMGSGALATLAVRGPQAWAMAQSLFRQRLPDKPAPGKFYLGKLGEQATACDEVVLAVRPDWLELHCHGGVEIVRFIEELFVARGARSGSWQELTLADVSPLRRLAHELLVQAPTVKTAAILLDQAQGALDNALAEIGACLENHDHAAASRRLSRLVGTQHLGRHLVQPFRVVIAGAPNVGKSSLVNALAGFTRSVVSPVAGTTRDVVTTRIALGGWPVELIDTAGIHDSADPLEREGMTRAGAVLEQADLRLWLLDASARAVLPPPGIFFDHTVVNKIDMPAVWDVEVQLPTNTVCVSAKTGQGMAELGQWIEFWLGLDKVLAPGEGVAFLPGICDQIQQASEAAQVGNWEKSRTNVENIVRRY
jgi:tRNA modification GTPase